MSQTNRHRLLQRTPESTTVTQWCKKKSACCVVDGHSSSQLPVALSLHSCEVNAVCICRWTKLCKTNTIQGRTAQNRAPFKLYWYISFLVAFVLLIIVIITIIIVIHQLQIIVTEMLHGCIVQMHIIQIWTAVECNGAIYCTVVTSYCPRPKLFLKPSWSGLKE